MTKTRAEEGSVPVTITDDDRSLLEQEIEDGYTPVRKLLGENAALSAKVARLRAELDEAQRRPTVECARRSESELAAANALLERGLLVAENLPLPQPVTWIRDTRAHLAGLPTAAAPTRAAAEQRVPQCPKHRPHDGGHSLAYTRYGEPCDWCGTRPEVTK